MRLRRTLAAATTPGNRSQQPHLRCGGIQCPQGPGRRSCRTRSPSRRQARAGLDRSGVRSAAGRKPGAACRRAGFSPRQPSDIHSTSLDSVSRDPQHMPFAAYPWPTHRGEDRAWL